MKKFYTLFITFLLLLTPLSVAAKGDIYEVAEKHNYKVLDTDIPYRLLLPDDYDESKEYPMLVFFHGAGERGNDNEKQFVNCVQYIYDNVPEDCIIVVPQCPENQQWVDTPWSLGPYSIDKTPESNELNAVYKLARELSDSYSVDKERIYALGISMGAFAVWDVMVRHHDFFAAGIAVCGGGDPTKSDLLKDIPMYVFHGDVDTDVPVSGSRDTVAAIRKAGGTKIEYTEYTGWGHGIWNKAFAEPELFDKLLSHKLDERYGKPDESSDAESSEIIDSADSNITESDAIADDNGVSETVIVLICVAVILVCAAIIVFVFTKKKGEQK